MGSMQSTCSAPPAPPAAPSAPQILAASPSYVRLTIAGERSSALSLEHCPQAPIRTSPHRIYLSTLAPSEPPPPAEYTASKNRRLRNHRAQQALRFQAHTASAHIASLSAHSDVMARLNAALWITKPDFLRKCRIFLGLIPRKIRLFFLRETSPGPTGRTGSFAVVRRAALEYSMCRSCAHGRRAMAALKLMS